MKRLLKLIQYLFLGVLLLFLGKIFLHLFDERYVSCDETSVGRSPEICRGFVKHMDWWMNGHTFSPTFGLPFANFRATWCALNIKQEDQKALESLVSHPKRSVSRSAEGMLLLLEAENNGKAAPGQDGTIFDPRNMFYILKNKCEKT